MRTNPAVERRQQPRVPLEDNAKVRILAPRERPTGLVNFSTTEGYLFDLNNLGAYVATELVLQKGFNVDIVIDLPGMRVPEQVQALVARRSESIRSLSSVVPAGLGLRFIAETRKEWERIRRIVMMTLTLDLLKYGYENRRTIRFWQDVLADCQFCSSDWQQAHSATHSQNIGSTDTLIINVPDSKERDPLEAHSREQAGLHLV